MEAFTFEADGNQLRLLCELAVCVPVHSSETPSFAYAAIGIRPI